MSPYEFSQNKEKICHWIKWEKKVSEETMFQDINHLLGLMGENYPYKYFLMKTFSIRWNTLNSDLHSKS